jgi:hypothetical protein
MIATRVDPGMPGFEAAQAVQFVLTILLANRACSPNLHERLFP